MFPPRKRLPISQQCGEMMGKILAQQESLSAECSVFSISGGQRTSDAAAGPKSHTSQRPVRFVKASATHRPPPPAFAGAGHVLEAGDARPALALIAAQRLVRIRSHRQRQDRQPGWRHSQTMSPWPRSAFGGRPPPSDVVRPIDKGSDSRSKRVQMTKVLAGALSCQTCLCNLRRRTTAARSFQILAVPGTARLSERR